MYPAHDIEYLILRGTHQAWSNKNSYIVYSLITLTLHTYLVILSFLLTPKYAQFIHPWKGRRPMVMGNGVSHGFPQGAARRQVLPIVFLMLKSLQPWWQNHSLCPTFNYYLIPSLYISSFLEHSPHVRHSSRCFIVAS